MKTTSFRDVEQLSAYLDGKLSQAEKTRLESRMGADPALKELLNDLRSAHTALRRTPRRSVPHNFTLTKKMAGVRPPLPRLVPALSWASAAAAFLFILTLGSNLVGQLSFGAAAPMLAASPLRTENLGAGGTQPLATQAPSSDNYYSTTTPEIMSMVAPQPTPETGTGVAAPPQATKSAGSRTSIWLFVWLGAAIILLGGALLIRWMTLHAFRRRS